MADRIGLAGGRARVLRAARLVLTLPPGLVEAAGDEGCDLFAAAIDAASLADAVARVATLPGQVRIAWAMPVARPGLAGWLLARARRLRPVVLEDACDALRRAGVVDLRVTTVQGSLPIVVLSGSTTST